MKSHTRIGERGMAIYASVVILALVIPMMGLAVDVTLLYVLKARLQGAVDGAALAAGKALARGSDDTTQKNAAATAAATYVKLNYPSSYFFSNDVTIDQTLGNDVIIDESVANQRTITVKAHVIEPTLFMKWLSFNTTNINASATTVRRDVNIALVLDRSGSMTQSGSCGPMKQAAINFMSNFAPGRDNVSIVSFATTVIVQMPITTNYKDSTGNGTGIDPAVAINSIQCQGSTSSAAALWNAYDQLVGLNQTAALNFIVFFTDGEPTGIAANMPITNASPCNDPNIPTVPVGAANIPTGLPAGYVGRYIPGMYATYVDGSAFIGNASFSASANSNGTLPSNVISANDQIIAPFSTGCAYAANFLSTTITDFRGIPTTDIYGSSATFTGYEAVTLANGYVDITNHSNGIPLATNTADDAARRIRIGAVDNYPNNYNRGLNGVIIDAIGLLNANVPLPSDGVFLKRVTNDPGSNLQPNNYPQGLYVYANQSSDVAAAFGQIASEILRLAK